MENIVEKASPTSVYIVPPKVEVLLSDLRVKLQNVISEKQNLVDSLMKRINDETAPFDAQIATLTSQISQSEQLGVK